MTIQREFFTNYSVRKALFFKMGNLSQKVTFEKKSWSVGKKSYNSETLQKISGIKSFFFKQFHRLKLCFNKSYKRKFTLALYAFEKAQCAYEKKAYFIQFTEKTFPQMSLNLAELKLILKDLQHQFLEARKRNKFLDKKIINLQKELQGIESKKRGALANLNIFKEKLLAEKPLPSRKTRHIPLNADLEVEILSCKNKISESAKKEAAVGNKIGDFFKEREANFTKMEELKNRGQGQIEAFESRLESFQKKIAEHLAPIYSEDLLPEDEKPSEIKFLDDLYKEVNQETSHFFETTQVNALELSPILSPLQSPSKGELITEALLSPDEMALRQFFNGLRSFAIPKALFDPWKKMIAYLRLSKIPVLSECKVEEQTIELSFNQPARIYCEHNRSKTPVRFLWLLGKENNKLKLTYKNQQLHVEGLTIFGKNPFAFLGTPYIEKPIVIFKLGEKKGAEALKIVVQVTKGFRHTVTIPHAETQNELENTEYLEEGVTEEDFMRKKEIKSKIH